MERWVVEQGSVRGLKLNAHLDPLAAECCSLQLRTRCERTRRPQLWKSGNLECLATNMWWRPVCLSSLWQHCHPSIHLHSCGREGAGEGLRVGGHMEIRSWERDLSWHHPLHLEYCPPCSGHHCNLNNLDNKHLIPSSSYLAVQWCFA